MAARDPLHGIVDSRITRPPPQGAGEEEEDERCERERYASPTAARVASLCRAMPNVMQAQPPGTFDLSLPSNAE